MKTPYKIVELTELQLDDFKPVFFDTETVGLYGKVRLAQFYQAGDEVVQMVSWPEEFQLALLLNKYHLVIHNAHYDITVVQQNTDTRWVPENFDDTFLLARLAQPKHERFSLDEVVSRVLGFDPYERQHLDKKKLQKTDWGKAWLTEDQKQYAATDVYYMPQVWDAVCSETNNISYRLDKLSLGYALDFQWNGMSTDSDRINERFATNLARVAELDVPVNVNSWKQVREYLDCTESDDLALATMSINGDTKAAAVRETRKLLKQNSFLKKYQRSDMLYGKFKPSARSGRFTSDDENMQQIPRALKGIFTVEDGEEMIYADYAQLELRTVCAITACSLMAQKFYEGEDLHDFTASMIFGENFTKDQRQLTKTANFNFLLT